MSRQQDLENGVMSELLISDVNRDDGGSYTCQASNMFGSDQTTVLLSVQGDIGLISGNPTTIFFPVKL